MDTETEHTAKNQSIYLILGDSISTGYQPEGPALTDKAFFGIIAKDGGYSMDNRAVNGNTSSGLWEQFAQGALDSAIARASLITITIGGNDLVAPLFTDIKQQYNQIAALRGHQTVSVSEMIGILTNPTDPRYTMALGAVEFFTAGLRAMSGGAFDLYLGPVLRTFRDNLDRITGHIHDLNPKAAVIVETQYYPYYWLDTRFRGVLEDAFSTVIAAFNQVIQEQAVDAEGIARYRVAGTYQAFADHFAKDPAQALTNAVGIELDFHPNAAGHAVIAAAMEKAIA
jgi:lysophospholipase L1-like esterase